MAKKKLKKLDSNQFAKSVLDNFIEKSSAASNEANITIKSTPKAKSKAK